MTLFTEKFKIVTQYTHFGGPNIRAIKKTWKILPSSQTNEAFDKLYVYMGTVKVD